MKLNSVIVAFSFSLTFLWYTYITSGPFYSVSLQLRTIFNGFLDEFFNAGSRGETTLAGLGLSQPTSILHNIGRYFHIVTTFFILIGFISLLAKWKKERLDSEYVLLIFSNMALLLLTIIVPGFAGILEMGRFYIVALLFVSPLFVLGGETLFGKALNLKKEKKKEGYCLVLTSIVLVAFFLFQTGLGYEITGDPVPSSISLSLYKMQDAMPLIHESDVFGATWLSKFGDVEHIGTYSDGVSYMWVLTSYSTINRNMTTIISNTSMITSTAYTYFRQFNVIKGIVIYDARRIIPYNISELPIFNSTAVFNNKIYSNGACEIYYSTPKV